MCLIVILSLFFFFFQQVSKAFPTAKTKTITLSALDLKKLQQFIITNALPYLQIQHHIHKFSNAAYPLA